MGKGKVRNEVWRERWQVTENDGKGLTAELGDDEYGYLSSNEKKKRGDDMGREKWKDTMRSRKKRMYIKIMME